MHGAAGGGSWELANSRGLWTRSCRPPSPRESARAVRSRRVDSGGNCTEFVRLDCSAVFTSLTMLSR